MTFQIILDEIENNLKKIMNLQEDEKKDEKKKQKLKLLMKN